MNSKKMLSLIMTTCILSGSLFLNGGIKAKANEINSIVSAQEQKISKEKLSKQEITTLKAWFSLYGVTEDVQTSLLKKFNKGELWDSMKENSTPINIEKGENIEGKYTKVTFADGSIQVTTVENVLDNPIQGITGTISGGRTVSSSLYHTHRTDVKASVSIGIVTTSFLFEYVTNRSAYDELRRVYDPNINVVGGTYSDKSYTVDKPKEDYVGPATGYLEFKYTTWSDSSDHLIRFRVFVGNDTVWAESN